jgi:hypothetical protein
MLLNKHLNKRKNVWKVARMLTVCKNYPARILTGKVTLLDTSGDVKVQGATMVYKSKRWRRHENDTCGGGVQYRSKQRHCTDRGGYRNGVAGTAARATDMNTRSSEQWSDNGRGCVGRDDIDGGRRPHEYGRETSTGGAGCNGAGVGWWLREHRRAATANAGAGWRLRKDGRAAMTNAGAGRRLRKDRRGRRPWGQEGGVLRTGWGGHDNADVGRRSSKDERGWEAASQWQERREPHRELGASGAARCERRWGTGDRNLGGKRSGVCRVGRSGWWGRGGRGWTVLLDWMGVLGPPIRVVTPALSAARNAEGAPNPSGL